MSPQPQLLTTEFFQLAHDDTSGRPRLSKGVLGLGLAGALLAELILDTQLTVHEGAVTVISYQPPADELAVALLELIRSERHQHPLRDWLAYLARDAPNRVAQRMVRSGHLHTERSRHLLHSTIAFVPPDWSKAAWPGARLRQQLSKAEPMPWPDVVLAGLATACGLAEHVTWDIATDGGRAYLEHLLAALTSLSPPLSALVTETQAAVGNAVLSHRT